MKRVNKSKTGKAKVKKRGVAQDARGVGMTKKFHVVLSSEEVTAIKVAGRAAGLTDAEAMKQGALLKHRMGLSYKAPTEIEKLETEIARVTDDVADAKAELAGLKKELRRLKGRKAK